MNANNQTIDTLRQENERLREEVAALRQALAERDRPDTSQHPHIDVLGVPIEWQIEEGICTFQGAAVATMFINPTLAGLMSGFHKMVGTKRFFLAMQSEGRSNIDIDWQIIKSQPSFEEGFAAWSNFPILAGWGRWEITSLDRERKECRIRVYNSFEGLYQQALGVCWGSGVAAGKCAGIFSLLFETECWADQETFLAQGDAFDSFVVRPSSRSIEQEIESLLASDEATRADLAVALQRLQDEVEQRTRIEAELRASQEQLQFALEGSGDGAWDWQVGAQEVDLSDRYHEMLGYQPGELSTNVDDWLNDIHPDDLPTVQQHLHDYLEGRSDTYAVEYRSRHQSGDWLWILSRGKVVVRDAAGRPQRMTGTITDISERKRMEEELRIFKTVVERANDAIGFTDTNGTITYSNPAHRALFGYGDEIIGLPVTETVAPEGAAVLADGMQQVMAQGHWRGESINRRKDGSTFPVEASIFTVDDEHGSLQAVVGFVRDITERKRQEEDLRLTQAALDQATDMVLWHDTEGRTVYANQAACRNLGYPRDELLTLRVPDLDPNFTLEAAKEVWQAVETQGSLTIETSHRRKDGSIFPAEVRINAMGHAGRNYLCVFANDITERKRQEEDLRLTQAALDQANDMVLWHDANGHMVYANDATCRNLGYSRDELFTLRVPDLDPNVSPEAVHEIWQTVQAQGSLTLDTAHRRKDGSTFPAEVRISPLRYGEQNYLCVFANDITERKRQEDELRMFEALVENAPSLISVADPEGRYKYLNPAFRERMGISLDTPAPTLTIRDIAPPEMTREEQQAQMQHILEHGSWRGRVLFQCRNGNTFPGDLAVFITRDTNGSPEQFIAIASDISEQVASEAERAALQQQVIDAQRDALRELSSPLIPISDDVVIMPLIGTIDSQRAQQVMEALLEGVAQHQAELVILDITGVSVVDTQVAQAFIQAAQAVRLLGAQVMLTGIQPQIAQTLVHLGVDLSGILTQGSLQAGIATALR